MFQRYLYESGSDEIVGPLEIDLRNLSVYGSVRKNLDEKKRKMKTTLRTSHEQHRLNSGGEQSAATYSVEISYDKKKITLYYNAKIALIVSL